MGHTAKFGIKLSTSSGIEPKKNVWSIISLLVLEIWKSFEYLKSYYNFPGAQVKSNELKFYRLLSLRGRWDDLHLPWGHRAATLPPPAVVWGPITCAALPSAVYTGPDCPVQSCVVLLTQHIHSHTCPLLSGPPAWR